MNLIKHTEVGDARSACAPTACSGEHCSHSLATPPNIRRAFMLAFARTSHGLAIHEEHEGREVFLVFFVSFVDHTEVGDARSACAP
ncbi:MAG: hypothetical protein HY741_12625, partial [Chloroflexi bacterium]|nr:hypothetical protein [Chloroflexota bacterium]